MLSELVDEVTDATGRVGKRSDVIRYANATIRECQAQAYFFRDSTETALLLDGSDSTVAVQTDNSVIWTFPTSPQFRLLRTAKYPVYGPVGNIPPGRSQEGVTAFYYAGPTYFVFSGAGNIETEIDIMYYSYLRRLVYYAVSTRPAVYDVETDSWTYLLNGAYVPTLGSTALDDAAKLLVTNWLLNIWRETILEGTLAKAMLAVDDARGPKHYAVYTSLKKAILQGETFEALNT